MPEGGPSIAITFPIFIAILIPLRERVLTKYFTANELAHLEGDAKKEDGPSPGGSVDLDSAIRATNAPPATEMELSSKALPTVNEDL